MAAILVLFATSASHAQLLHPIGPEPPSISLTVGPHNTVTLNWSGVRGADHYNLYKGPKGNEALYQPDIHNTLQFTDTSVEPRQTYSWYYIEVVVPGVRRARSAEVSSIAPNPRTPTPTYWHFVFAPDDEWEESASLGSSQTVTYFGKYLASGDVKFGGRSAYGIGGWYERLDDHNTTDNLHATLYLDEKNAVEIGGVQRTSYGATSRVDAYLNSMSITPIGRDVYSGSAGLYYANEPEASTGLGLDVNLADSYRLTDLFSADMSWWIVDIDHGGHFSGFDRFAIGVGLSL